MKTIAIIAEFNPFHNGHHYLLHAAKATTGADYCLVVMSGNFVQRGAPAITPQHLRAQMALLNGADLVLELPVCYAVGSAEFFARGAVGLLNRLGVTDWLFFGSECGDINALAAAAAAVSNETAYHQSRLRQGLKQGLSFPAARQKAFDLPPELFNSPNNILGIEYCKALYQQHSGIIPLTVRRKGGGYHDVQLSSARIPEDISSLNDGGHYSSASAIRCHLNAGGSPAELGRHLPDNILPLLSGSGLIDEEDFSLLLHYKLLCGAADGFTEYLDVTGELSDKIKKQLYSFTSYRDFIGRLKSRDMTFTRLSRCLTHILLDVRRDDLAAYREEHVFYARILGFRQDAGPLLHAIKQHASVPLLSKLADAPALLSPLGLMMFNQDLRAAHIYNAVYAAKYGLPPTHEYTRPIVRI